MDSDPTDIVRRHFQWCEEMRSRVAEEEKMERLIEEYEAAGWEVEYSPDGAISFSKPVTPLKFTPRQELLPKQEPDTILAVVRGLGGKIKSIFKVKKSL